MGFSSSTLDVSMVVSVIAALGLGRLISLLFSGPLSDKYGRKLSGIIGVRRAVFPLESSDPAQCAVHPVFFTGMIYESSSQDSSV